MWGSSRNPRLLPSLRVVLSLRRRIAQKEQSWLGRAEQNAPSLCNRNCLKRQPARRFPFKVMALILHAEKRSIKAFKALIVAEYCGVQVELAPDSEMGVTNNEAREFFDPVPILETPDGRLFMSNVVARYVARLNRENNPLFGSSLIDKAHVDQWIDFASTEIAPTLFHLRANPHLVPAHSQLKILFATLNAHLANKTYLVGNSVTLADIITTCDLYFGFSWCLPKSFTSKFPRLEHYFWYLVNQPKFQKILGQVKQTEEKPKPKNPLDLLPPSKMLLYHWKRLYCGSRDFAIKRFWDMYDPEGFSLWFCDDDYNDEHTDSSKALDMVGRFLQQIGVARKYAFGRMLVIRPEQLKLKVKGVWLFRGQEIPQFVIDECSDVQLYKWTKVDISDKAQKERVIQMLEARETFEGVPLLGVKCFK